MGGEVEPGLFGAETEDVLFLEKENSPPRDFFSELCLERFFFSFLSNVDPLEPRRRNSSALGDRCGELGITVSVRSVSLLFDRGGAVRLGLGVR